MTTCPKCGAKLEPDWHFCMNCSTPVESPPTQLPTPANATSASRMAAPVPGLRGYPPPHVQVTAAVERKFPVLRFVAKFLKVAAVIQVAGGLTVGIIVIVALNQPAAAARAGSIFLLTLIFGVLGGLYSWAFADFILVALAVEENTRAMRLGVK
jgi:zinc-ribbon domain